MRTRLRTRRLLLGATLVGSIVVLPGQATSAHVHGVTPLNECTVDPANAGALQTNETPAAAPGGPITGLIPRDTGNAPLGMGDGGFNAPVQCP
jgi:hypothetical protein